MTFFGSLLGIYLVNVLKNPNMGVTYASIFAISGFFRLAVAVSVGQFSINALVLTLEALPVAYLVTTITASKHPPLSPSKLKALVCCLLIAVGAAMAITATMALTR